MPARNPKYGNASDGYSANPATRRVRARVARLDPDQREAHRVYSREYTALWQATKRFARRDEYKSALIPERRRMLLKHLRGIIERRRKAGKEIHGIKPETVIENQLKKEITVMRQDGILAADGLSLKDILSMDDNEGLDDDDDELEKAQEEMDDYDYEHMMLGSIAHVEQKATAQEDILSLTRDVCALRKEVRFLARHVAYYQSLLRRPIAQRAHPAMRRRHRSLSPSGYVPPSTISHHPRPQFANTRGRTNHGDFFSGGLYNDLPPFSHEGGEEDDDDAGHDENDLDGLEEHHYLHPSREPARPHPLNGQLHLDPSFVMPQHVPRRLGARAPVAMMDPHDLPPPPPPAAAHANEHHHPQQPLPPRDPVSSADNHYPANGATPRSSMLDTMAPQPGHTGGVASRARHPSQPITPYYQGAVTPALFSGIGPAFQYPDPAGLQQQPPQHPAHQHGQHSYANYGGMLHNSYRAEFPQQQHPPQPQHPAQQQQQQGAGEQQQHQQPGANPQDTVDTMPEQ